MQLSMHARKLLTQKVTPDLESMQASAILAEAIAEDGTFPSVLSGPSGSGS